MGNDRNLLFEMFDGITYFKFALKSNNNGLINCDSLAQITR